MLVVEEAPKDSHKEVEDGYASIKGQLGDLGTRQLAVCIAEFDDSLVVGRSVLVREDTVVARVLDIVLDRLRVFEVDGLSLNQVLGLDCRIR